MKVNAIPPKKMVYYTCCPIWTYHFDTRPEMEEKSEVFHVRYKRYLPTVYNYKFHTCQLSIFQDIRIKKLTIINVSYEKNLRVCLHDRRRLSVYLSCYESEANFSVGRHLIRSHLTFTFNF